MELVKLLYCHCSCSINDNYKLIFFVALKPHVYAVYTLCFFMGYFVFCVVGGGNPLCCGGVFPGFTYQCQDSGCRRGGRCSE